MRPSDVALAVFLLPPAALLALVAGLCACLAVLVWFAAFRLHAPVVARTPQAAFHVSLTALFALLLSFTASDAWRRGDAAYLALLREAGEVSALLQLSDALPAAAPLRAELRDYLRLSLAEEWTRHNAVASEAAGDALDRLRARALGLLDAAPTVSRLALDRVDGIAAARGARLVAGGLYGDALRWTVLVVLLTLGLTAIAVVHWDRPASAPPALALYAAAAAVALGLVAAGEHPYAGWDGTTPDRLAVLLSRLG